MSPIILEYIIIGIRYAAHILVSKSVMFYFRQIQSLICLKGYCACYTGIIQRHPNLFTMFV